MPKSLNTSYFVCLKKHLKIYFIITYSETCTLRNVMCAIKYVFILNYNYSSLTKKTLYTYNTRYDNNVNMSQHYLFWIKLSRMTVASCRYHHFDYALYNI